MCDILINQVTNKFMPISWTLKQQGKPHFRKRPNKLTQVLQGFNRLHVDLVQRLWWHEENH